MPATKQPHRRPRPTADFADLIITARRDLNLSQDELAVAAGVNRSTIIRWESGHAATADPDPLRSVCHVLDIGYLDALIALGTITTDDLVKAA